MINKPISYSYQKMYTTNRGVKEAINQTIEKPDNIGLKFYKNLSVLIGMHF